MSADLLLGATSDFWKNHFKDYAAVKAVVEGAFSSAAESYRTLSAGVLSRSIDSAPTRLKRKYKILSVLGHKVLLKTSVNSSGTTYLWYVIECPETMKSIPTIISNVGDEPKSVLTQGEDYFLYSGSGQVMQQLFSADTSWIEASKRYLIFRSNPLEVSGAQKSKLLVQDYYKLTVHSESSAWKNHVSVGSAVTMSGSLKSRVLFVDSDEDIIYLDPTAPARTETSELTIDNTTYTLQVSSELFYLEVPTAYLVAFNSQEELGYLHSNFGFRYFDSRQESSEYLRKKLKGLALLKTAPPTKDTLLSAIHLILGLPVIEAGDSVGEFLIESKSQANSGNKLVRTSLASYVVPSGVGILQDIQDGLEFVDGVLNNNITEYPLTRLEPICTGVEIYPDTSTAWWYDESLVYELPQAVAPGLSAQLDRKIIQGTHDNEVGSPSVGSIPEQRVGDYHFKVGDATRSVLATALTEDFLKWKLIGIKFSQALYDNWGPLSSDRELLLGALQDALPVGTLLVTNL